MVCREPMSYCGLPVVADFSRSEGIISITIPTLPLLVSQLEQLALSGALTQNNSTLHHAASCRSMANSRCLSTLVWACVARLQLHMHDDS